ncbi:DUF2061 domain-containing protein [Chitinibacter sp. SCUT-21]|uniref:DUF2061 domain-containing protein n=1 Tax=Chitinibacter sp. SCUT-21 TaxID=2970891 RepID=UPI0035A6C0AB
MTKTITFAIVHFTVAFSVAYLLTGSFGVASALALIEPMVNTVAYFFHEKAWDAYRLTRSLMPQSTDSAADVYHG